jgi:hypothetical protein
VTLPVLQNDSAAKYDTRVAGRKPVWRHGRAASAKSDHRKTTELVDFQRLVDSPNHDHIQPPP